MMTANNSKQDNTKQSHAKEFCYTASDKAFLATLEAKKTNLNEMLKEKTESDPSNVVMAITGAAGAIAGISAIEIGGPIWGGLTGIALGDAWTVSKDEVVNELADLDAKFTSTHASCELLANAMQNVDQSHWPAVTMALHNEELKAQASGNTDPAAIVENLNAVRVKLATCVNQLYSTDNSNGVTNDSSNIQQNVSPQVDSCMSQ
jgi:hypothetical protein